MCCQNKLPGSFRHGVIVTYSSKKKTMKKKGTNVNPPPSSSAWLAGNPACVGVALWTTHGAHSWESSLFYHTTHTALLRSALRWLQYYSTWVNSGRHLSHLGQGTCLPQAVVVEVLWPSFLKGHETPYQADFVFVFQLRLTTTADEKKENHGRNSWWSC